MPADIRRPVSGDRTYAFGVLLQLTTTDEGGRHTPLLGGSGESARFEYRPNWGLPQMTSPEQTAAPVLAFSREHIQPGDEVRVIIVPPIPSMLPEWALVEIGDKLPMYEGPHVCGHGRVLWRRNTQLPLPEPDEDRFRAWLVGPGDVLEPSLGSNPTATAL